MLSSAVAHSDEDDHAKEEVKELNLVRNLAAHFLQRDFTSVANISQSS
jgi:hypothetical protein